MNNRKKRLIMTIIPTFLVIMLVSIISRDFGIRNWCGYTIGSKILINTNEMCSHMDKDVVLKHELWHIQWEMLPLNTRINYCDSIGMQYTTDCWEAFVEE